MLWFSKETIVSLAEQDLSDEKLFVHKQVVSPNKKTKAIVDRDHVAIFIKDGEYQGVLESGKHALVEKGEKNVAKIDLVFVSKVGKVEIKWGTANKFELRDHDDMQSLVAVRGAFEVKISNLLKAYQTLVEANVCFDVEKLKDRLKSRMCNEIQHVLSHCIQQKGIAVGELSQSKDDIAELITPIVSEMFLKDYGLSVVSFAIDEILIN